MIIETFNAVDDNGNLYRISIDQEYTIIRDRSGNTTAPGMKRAFDSLGHAVNPVEPPDLWEIAATGVRIRRTTNKI